MTLPPDLVNTKVGLFIFRNPIGRFVTNFTDFKIEIAKRSKTACEEWVTCFFRVFSEYPEKDFGQELEINRLETRAYAGLKGNVADRGKWLFSFVHDRVWGNAA
jgi:hypothetical protein